MVKISVIVPTRNRADYLMEMLSSLKAQTITQDLFEVIVVDNGSTDSTKSICELVATEIKHFRYIYDERPGLHVGRNRGYLESKGEFLVYADDDILPFPTWLEGMLQGFCDYGASLVGGNVFPKYEGEVPIWEKDFTEKNGIFRVLQPLSCVWAVKPDYCQKISPSILIVGCNFGVSREVIKNCGGFHPDGMPDNLLMFRGDGETHVSKYVNDKKLIAYFISKASVYHVISKERTKEEKLYKIAFRGGVSNMYTCLRANGFLRGTQMLLREGISFFVITEKEKVKKKHKLYHMLGEIYLLSYYFFYKEIRNWIHKKDYMRYLL